MTDKRRDPRISMWWLLIFILLGSQRGLAQGTAFTYQGNLGDAGSPASGSYDFQFKLFDAISGGVQQGADVVVSNVAVTAGIFTVQLDFGACPTCFNGAPRFIEISVKQTGGSTYATLTPRQQVTSNPYAIRSLNATAADGLSVACVNCITSSQIQNVAGSSVTGTIPVASVPDLSASYIKNTTSQQASANFNIIGTGTAGTFNATTQYNIGGSRILGAPGTNNLFAGLTAGQANTSGASNAFVGASAGMANTVGARNAFFGFNAGRNNVGDAFGNGSDNAFFGSSAGLSNSGQQNSFFGSGAGAGSTSGNFNSFFGEASGLNNTTGGFNTFIGSNTGFSGLGPNSTSGSNNTAIGVSAKIGLDPSGANLSNATAIGANAAVSCTNCFVLGDIAAKVRIGDIQRFAAFLGFFEIDPKLIAVGDLVDGGDGVVGVARNGQGVFGFSDGTTPNAIGVFGVATNSAKAGVFQGPVDIQGPLTKSSGSFKIDHPLDPANKYLYHSFVESPDMMNIYNGSVTLDANGEAIVEMPQWFEALNRDFQYQLTCIGGYAPVYIADELNNNHFKVAGGTPGMKVSWQVTGIRHDAWADAHRIKVEEDKPANERGYYLFPQGFSQPEEKGIEWVLNPTLMRKHEMGKRKITLTRNN